MLGSLCREGLGPLQGEGSHHRWIRQAVLPAKAITAHPCLHPCWVGIKKSLKQRWLEEVKAEPRERVVETASQKVAFTLLSSSTTFSVSFPSSLALTL